MTLLFRIVYTWAWLFWADCAVRITWKLYLRTGDSAYLLRYFDLKREVAKLTE